jgi:ferredoxin
VGDARRARETRRPADRTTRSNEKEKKESGDDHEYMVPAPHSKVAPLVAVILAFAMPVRAGDFQPLPNFANHEIPDTQHPPSSAERTKYLSQAAEAADVEFTPPSAKTLDLLDVAALTVGLALASYFALVRRSRRGLFWLAIASLAWLGFWRKGCVCPIGAIQNVALALFDPSYVIPLAVVSFFVLPLVFTLFFGRTFCAAVCPLGAVQELVAVRPQKVPTWLDQTLGLLAYVYLGLAVALAATGSAFVVCRYDPFVGLFRMSAGLDMLVLSAGFLVAGIFVGRPYCRYLCPYGALLGLLSRVARWHVRIPPKDCIQCRLCEDSCPYGAIQTPTVVPPTAQRHKARWWLSAAILLLPVLVGLGAWLGGGMGGPLARLHPTVQLAERMWMEENEEVEGTTDATDNFRNTGQKTEDLYATAGALTRKSGVAGVGFGAWVGLVIGVKLIHLSVRRRRTEYRPDRANCVACGRCFWYCPNEQARRNELLSITTNENQQPTKEQEKERYAEA